LEAGRSPQGLGGYLGKDDLGKRAILALTALCVLVVKIAIAYNTYGTNDARTFEADIAKLESVGAKALYQQGVEPRPGNKQPFSHSPALIHGLLLLRKLENKSGMPVRFWLRVCCALADLASLGLLFVMGVRSGTALLTAAFAPAGASIMISGFHVNTDPIMVCAVLLSVYLVQSQRFVWAGTVLGIALSIKPSALLFVPGLIVAAGARRSAEIIGVATLSFFGLSLPFIWHFPFVIGTSMLTYAGLYKFWGIPALSLLTGSDGVYKWYESFGKFVALGVIGAAAVAVGYRGRRERMLTNCGLSAALFLLFTPGFGFQYLAYLVPWLAVTRRFVAISFHLICGAFMIAAYTWGSRGVPWDLSNFFLTRYMPAHVFFLGLVTWVLVGLVAAEFVRLSLSGRFVRGRRIYRGHG
jgi:hypothetical protein